MTRATTIVILLIVLLTSVLLVYAAGASTAFLPQVYNAEPSPTPEVSYTWTYIFFANNEGDELVIWGAKPGYCYKLIVSGGSTINIVSEKDMDNCDQDGYNPDADWPPPEFPPPDGVPVHLEYEVFQIVMERGARRVCGTLNCVGVK